MSRDPASAFMRTYCVPGREACEAGVMSYFTAVETEARGEGGVDVIRLRSQGWV